MNKQRKSMSRKATHADMAPTLETLRGELDAIDQRLLETLRERLGCCMRIGHYHRYGVRCMGHVWHAARGRRADRGLGAEPGVAPVRGVSGTGCR
jgi:hypothetical protein